MDISAIDLYHIFILHNRAWTHKEIVIFTLFFIIAISVADILLQSKKIAFLQAVAGLLLLFFLGIVFGSTVFTRNPKPYHDYELELFWSWKAVYHGNREMLKENLLNMVLLFPAGILLPMMYMRKMPWWKGLMIGSLIAAVIEISQLIFCRGLFEWDDIIHNGVGCMLGCMTSSLFMKEK